ncbi:DoxX family protein [Legionella oakridgensis]|uniref:DoxX protein n=2 Tax=Legionella oakridgensis TaxID=29423 RepID=W0BD53_9GAMM|nr:DoxX family membrane protein [Legionella oakridgensis]AHE67770.1 DoxX protein [Legionella oakridgensis ATCC 33761 = DSM 21215]ETO92672.1 DoxX protein [Legionella oakridgensis RV-2-2007]KTD36904.1 DoxX [Legionella oakridgensis]STY20787.1 DoxX [Legionella longbeachae]
MEIAAFVVLRIILAWMFLYPLKAQLSDWDATVELVDLIAPFQPQLFAVLMVFVMIAGSLSVLFGIYAQVGAACLMIYSLIGVLVHYKLSRLITSFYLSATASNADQKILEKVQSLGVVGHVTSAQKNIVIASALWVIVCLGSGPYSLSGNLF